MDEWLQRNGLPATRTNKIAWGVIGGALILMIVFAVIVNSGDSDAQDSVQLSSETADRHESSGGRQSSIQSADTSAARAYSREMSDIATSMSESLDRFTDLSRNPQYLSTNWKTRVSSELLIWRANYYQIQRITPPTAMVEIHELTVAAFERYDSAAFDVEAGIDQINADLIYRAVDKINQGTRLLQEANRLLREAL